MLSESYERERASPQSLDAVLEWPAELEMIGPVEGLDILDVGCGGGAKSAELMGRGARSVTGIDITGSFRARKPQGGLSFIQADLSNLDRVTELAGRKFDLVLFLQSLGYAEHEVRTLRAARELLEPHGSIVVARSSPVRYAVEQSARLGIPMGHAYHHLRSVTYVSEWGDGIELTHRTETFSRMVNNLCRGGFDIRSVCEPRLSAAIAARYPQYKEWVDRYFGIIIFRADVSGHTPREP